MYSCKDNINILTSLLARHGVRHAVVCPGSRNAPIVHNLNECGLITCCPVTDERSAGFYALGMAQASGLPVIVCVTSGTALLNIAPAVAEAFYQHVPLIVVSADRPSSWIGQLDGQTLPQHGAFGCFVAKSVTLPEPHDDNDRWYCNRLINEAMLAAYAGAGCPVHINVPITEPLFEFTVCELPEERMIRRISINVKADAVCDEIVRRMSCSVRPMIVVGRHKNSDALSRSLQTISSYVVTLREPLSPGKGTVHFDEVLSGVYDNPSYMPDFVLYAGDTIVSKRLKKFLRNAPGIEIWAISADGNVHDTFMNQTVVVEADAEKIFCEMASEFNLWRDMTLHDKAGEFYERWNAVLVSAACRSDSFIPRYSQMLVVRTFEHIIEEKDIACSVHYANSSAVRLANIYAGRYIYVNRGVNGIEGSLSTAAGYSVVCDEPVLCVIGDLSFFYDSNALWSQNLRGNLRILLLNNGCGGIFNQLPGIEASPVRDSYIAAAHHASARGICAAHDIGYLAARNTEELEMHMQTFITGGTNRPLVFEVFTDASEDARVLKDYYEEMKKLTAGNMQ